MREDKSADDLLAAYVDGVTELSPDERRRVEARLDDPGTRTEEQATRTLLGQLRELPPTGSDPDWSALERSIHDAVGPDVPRSWWRGWRWAIPAVALAATAAICFVLLQRPGSHDAVVVIPPAPAVPDIERAPATDSVALWLDGRQVDVPSDADELLDDPLLELEDPAFVDGLLAPSDLAWAIDELDDEALDRAEKLLEHPQRRKKG